MPLESIVLVTCCLSQMAVLRNRRRCPPDGDLIRTSNYDEHSDSMNVTTRLHYISHCETASGANRSNSWTYREFITKTRRDKIELGDIWLTWGVCAHESNRGEYL